MPAPEDRLVALCAAEAVTEDAPSRAVHEEVAYAVFRCEDRFYVTQDACTHGPGSLSEGFVVGCEVECPFHQGRFHIPTGRPAWAPCTQGLRTWTVYERNGHLFIDPSERRPVEE